MFDEHGYVESVQFYLKHLLNIDKSENTIKNYVFHLKTYFEFLELYGLKYDEIHQDEKGIKPLSTFVGWLRNPDILSNVTPIKKEVKEDQRSAKTINIIMATVLGFYDFLSRTGRIGEIQAYRTISKRRGSDYQSFFTEMYFKGGQSTRQSIFKLRETKQNIRAVTRDEYNQILKGAGETQNPLRNQLMIALMFECGLRNSEVRGICTDDFIPWEQELNIVERDISVKYGSERTVYVPEHVMDLYANYISDEYNYEHDTDKEYQYLFRNDKGEPLSYSTIKKLCNKLSAKTGIKFSPHELRHGHGTELFESKVQQEVIMKRLGHKNIASTEVYTHVSDDYMKQELKKAEELRKNKEGLKHE